MRWCVLTLGRFVRDERGVTAIEYAILAGLVALVIVVAVTAIGIAVERPFNDLAAAVP